MPIRFTELCNLFQRLEDIEHRDPPLLQVDKVPRLKDVTEKWFKSHRRAIDDLDAKGATALLSSLLPERRSDRVYGLQATSLCRVLGRSLNLGATRRKDLEAYRQPGRGDLAICVERVLKAGGPPATPAVSVEEVDELLDVLASQGRFSDPGITNRLPPGSSEARDKLLANVFLRVSSLEGKWLVRLILKDFSPVRIHQALVLRLFHFLVPDLLRFQEDFEAILKLLKGPLKDFHAQPDPRSERLLRLQAAEKLRPAVGVKVGRPKFHKVRSIDQCMRMVGQARWVLERKYDGEYCEVHIDLTKSTSPADCIKIFSKGGKEYTFDRRNLHQTLIECLQLGHPGCKIKRRAILVGELLVYSDKENIILPFHHIRKHVSRSGVFLGTEETSQPRPYEHLAIVFFDLLLLDDEIVMNRPVEERRSWLREVYKKKHGRAISAEWKIVDFTDSGRARKLLIQQFAVSVAERCEGLVLKPCGVPYFSLNLLPDDYRHSFLKMKKDYVVGLGDEADFAVVGASYNAQHELKAGIGGLVCTSFHLGCAVNKDEVERFGARPVFQVVDTIRPEACIPKRILQALNTIAKGAMRPYEPGESLAKFVLLVPPTMTIEKTFREPLVLEVLGSGFEKPATCGFYTLRHARVKKLHEDRSWESCVSFSELQDQAAAARSAPIVSESQETRKYIEKLTHKAQRKFEIGRTPSSRSATTETPCTSGTNVGSEGKPPASRQLDSAGPVTPQLITRAHAALSSGSSGSTFVRQSSSGVKAKRTRSTATPCPSYKRRRTTKASAERKVSPLADITNSTPVQRQSPSHVKQKSFEPYSLVSTALVSPVRSSPPLALPDARNCVSSRCLFSDAVIYMAPCIQNMAYIINDLIQAHNITIVSRLAHWDRDSFSSSPLTDTVSESQAYAGLRKIVLVERKKEAAVKDLVHQISTLNDGCLRERVEMYDWRVLEQCKAHDLGAEALERYFVGVTIFDQAQDQALFVSRTPWISD